MNRSPFFKTLTLLLLLVGSSAFSKQLVCHYYVMGEFEFCSVTLTLLENGKLSSPASVNHQGQVYSSAIEEVSLNAGERFHLFLDVDKPGHELEMVVKTNQNEKGEFLSVLINPQASFAKEMQGKCQENTSAF